MDMCYKAYLNNISTFIFDIDGVLTNGTVGVGASGEFLRTTDIKDGYALRMAVVLGYRVCIISGGSDGGMCERLRGLGIDDVFTGAHNKLKPLQALIGKYNMVLENVLYMGDDIPDYPVMKRVGLPCCPQDAVPEIKEISKYISDKKGGNGAVRDVIEQTLKVQGKWNSLLQH